MSHVLISLLVAGCQPASLMPQIGTVPGGVAPTGGSLPGLNPAEAPTPLDALSDDDLLAEFEDDDEPVSVQIAFPLAALGNLQDELIGGGTGFGVANAATELTPDSLDGLEVALDDGDEVDTECLDFSDVVYNTDGTITTTMTVYENTPEEEAEILAAEAEAILDTEAELEAEFEDDPDIFSTQASGFSIMATLPKAKTPQKAVAKADALAKAQQSRATKAETAAKSTTKALTPAERTKLEDTAQKEKAKAETLTKQATTLKQQAATTSAPTGGQTKTAKPAPATTRQRPISTSTTQKKTAAIQKQPAKQTQKTAAATKKADKLAQQKAKAVTRGKAQATVAVKAAATKALAKAPPAKQASLQKKVATLNTKTNQLRTANKTTTVTAAAKNQPATASNLKNSAKSLTVQTPNKKVALETAIPRPMTTAKAPVTTVPVNVTTTATALITKAMAAEGKPVTTVDPRLVKVIADRLTAAAGAKGSQAMMTQTAVVAAVKAVVTVLTTPAPTSGTPLTTVIATNPALTPSGGGGGGAVAAVPTLTTASPAFGPIAGGTTVTLTGTNFTNNTSVTFGGVAVTALQLNNATSITVTTPATTVGAKDVVVTTASGSVTLTNGFNFTSGAVSTLAGSTQGDVDGTGTAAQFNFATGIAVDSAGNVYVSDQATKKIRKITPAGVVTTFAGSTAGNADGTGTAAQFNDPYAVAVDAADNVYVADTLNHRIRKITPAGVVTTLAGSTQGFADGTGTAAQFNDPQGVAVDAAGNVYVADSRNQRIRKITPAGVVTTLAGQATGGFADGTGAAAQFNFPFGIAVDSSGNIYAADFHNSKIRKITQAGVVTTFAGSTHGIADGTGTAAQFGNLYGISIDKSDNLYVVDRTNHKIRKVTPGAVVTTLAGSTLGNADGTSSTAQFNEPWGVAIGANGIIYVADTVNRRVRKIQ
jgi:ATP-dependent protease HslVU (ClpYQ) peptidase subunit